MKKMVVILTVVMVVLMAMTTIGYATQDPIWDNVYSWWKTENRETYELFINTEYGSEGFADNGTAYMAGYYISLWYDEFHSISYIKQYFDDAAREFGITDFESSVNCIGENNGRYVIELTMTTKMDLSKIKDSGFDVFDGPIYGMKMICYDRMYIPE